MLPFNTVTEGESALRDLGASMTKSGVVPQILACKLSPRKEAAAKLSEMTSGQPHFYSAKSGHGRTCHSSSGLVRMPILHHEY